MRQSSAHFEPGLERGAAVHGGPEEVHAHSREGVDGLSMSFHLGSLAVVKAAHRPAQAGEPADQPCHPVETLAVDHGQAIIIDSCYPVHLLVCPDA